jgi:hypothetical protein
MTADAKRIDTLQREMDAAAERRNAAALAAVARDVLEYQATVNASRTDPEPQKGERDYERLWEMAKRAMAILGGQAEPPLQTLADYDSSRYGPMLGVSDEGSATAAIRRGALAAPKAAALPERTPLSLGIAHDAERLGAVGEVAVGPDEFATIRLAARGRVLTTTNVGTRVNARLFLAPPELRVRRDGLDNAIERLKIAFAPFVKAVSGRPRKLTVLVRFSPNFPVRQRKAALRKLQAAVAAGQFCNPKWHCLGLYVNPGVGKQMGSRVRDGIDLAATAGLRDVAVVGLHDERFGPFELDEILEHAAERGVRVVPRDHIDPQTTARHVWTGLAVARHMGLELGKYGLVPLTFEDQKQVVARIQYWFPDWCAAPVFYVDYPLVTATRAYHGASLGEGVRKWLEMIAGLGVRVVLIDTAKKSEGRRLLKDLPDDDQGFFIADEVKDLTAFAVRLGVKVLWAGGITPAQAYTLGRLGVFGLYVTTAAASLLPLDAKTRRDPGMLGIREPQAPAVARVKLLIEAGFLVSRGAAQLAAGAQALLAALAANDEDAARQSESALHAATVEAWRTYLAGTS